jgi:hypothetical protein
MINRVAGLGQGTDRQPCGALPWSDGPHRLWSLWDMIQAIGVELFRLSEQLRSLDDNLAQLGAMVGDRPLSETVRAGFRSHYQGLQDSEVIKMFPYVAARYERLMKELSLPSITAAQMRNAVMEIKHRFEDELGNIMFYHVTHKTYYDVAGIFGNEVYDKFPAMQEDISEAGKCIAFDRPTAAVFHLMRVMDIGVQSFGTKLGVTLANEMNWQKILDLVNKGIKSRDHRIPETNN